MSRVVIILHLKFIEELYKTIKKNVDQNKIDTQKLHKIHKKCQ
jgi:hypothetical protein